MQGQHGRLLLSTATTGRRWRRAWVTYRLTAGLCGPGVAAMPPGRSRFLSESTKRHEWHRKPFCRTFRNNTTTPLALIRPSGACHAIRRIPKLTPFGGGASRTRSMSFRQSFRSIGASRALPKPGFGRNSDLFMATCRGGPERAGADHGTCAEPGCGRRIRARAASRFGSRRYRPISREIPAEMGAARPQAVMVREAGGALGKTDWQGAEGQRVARGEQRNASAVGGRGPVQADVVQAAQGGARNWHHPQYRYWALAPALGRG